MNRLIAHLRLLRTAGCSALLALSAGCAEFDFAEQDLSLRYVDDGDRIELNVKTRGIFATPAGWGQSEDQVLASGKERVEQMAAGARYFYLVTFPFMLDLDEGDWSEEEDWITKEQRERIWSLMDKSVSVTSASTFLDEAGEVALDQRVEIKNAKACVAAMNELVTLGVQHELNEAKGKPADLAEIFGSEASQDNLRAFVVAGGVWISLDAEALVVRVPMTPYDLALCMKAFLEETAVEGGSSGSDSDWADRRGAAAARALFANLEELTVEDGVVNFRFPVNARGRIPWSFRMPRHPDAKKFVAAFESEELK